MEHIVLSWNIFLGLSCLVQTGEIKLGQFKNIDIGILYLYIKIDIILENKIKFMLTEKEISSLR